MTNIINANSNQVGNAKEAKPLDMNDLFKAYSYEQVKDFGRNQKNRQIKPKHVNDFINVLKDKKEFPCNLAYGLIPVIYNPVTNHILDGQHKLEGYKDSIEKGLIHKDIKILVGFWEIWDEDLEKELIIQFNSNSKNWCLNDYLECYAQYNENYRKLKAFAEKHSLCYTINKDGSTTLNYRYPAAIITGKCCYGVLSKELFTATEEDLAKAHVVHEELVKIMGWLRMEKCSSVEPMAVSWNTHRRLITIDDLLTVGVTTSMLRNNKKNIRDWNQLFSEVESKFNISKLDAA